MPGAWVDHKSYVGPCRRCSGDKLRWAERRRVNVGGDPPSLSSLLRRLRVQAADLSSEEQRLGEQRTSVALEAPFRAGLQRMATARGLSLPRLILQIRAAMGSPAQPLGSQRRVYALIGEAHVSR